MHLWGGAVIHCSLQNYQHYILLCLAIYLTRFLLAITMAWYPTAVSEQIDTSFIKTATISCFDKASVAARRHHRYRSITTDYQAILQGTNCHAFEHDVCRYSLSSPYTRTSALTSLHKWTFSWSSTTRTIRWCSLILSPTSTYRRCETRYHHTIENTPPQTMSEKCSVVCSSAGLCWYRCSVFRRGVMQSC